MKKYLTRSLALCLLLIISAGILSPVCAHAGTDPAASAGLTSSTESEDAPVSTVRLIAVGDALIHDNVIASGLQKDGSYNYDAIFANIKDCITDADIRIINQETVFVNDSALYSGYPRFGTPTAMGDAMLRAGFNVITLATNHSYDKQKQGVVDTVNYWKGHKKEALTTGMYKTKKTYDKITYGEYNGIRIAFLNYTFVLNNSGNSLTKDQFYIKRSGYSFMKKEIKAARKEADLVIVLPHWGSEYKDEPNKTQKEYAQYFADWGADLIIGCHPHVLQPLEMITSKDGREVPCFYSVGNFVSNMTDTVKVLEGMADVTIAKDADGNVSISSCTMQPLICHIGSNDKTFTVYRLEDYTDKLLKKSYLYKKKKKNYDLDWMWEHFNSMLPAVDLDLGEGGEG